MAGQEPTGHTSVVKNSDCYTGQWNQVMYQNKCVWNRREGKNDQNDLL